MENSDISTILSCIISLVMIAGVIGLYVFLIKKGNEETRQSELACNEIMQRLPPDRQKLFLVQFSSQRKNPSTAQLLALFLGGVGAHRFYIGETGKGIFYVLFCWPGIPSLIAFFDCFTIAFKANQYNQQKANSLYAMLGGV